MKKALVYLRVSDPNQEIRDSLNKQEEQTLRYCEFKGYHIFKIIKEVGSGRRNDREGFKELEEEIENNSFDVLIFYELSRLARNTYILHNLIHDLKINKISFESVTENYLNSDSPTSKLMLSFIASMAEMESDMTSKRVQNRMKYYTSQGFWMFQPPKGYVLENKILKINDNESEEVKSIYNEFLKGASYADLSREYNISHPGLINLLTNVAYIGKTKFGFEGRDKDTGKRFKGGDGTVYEGKHESIIDRGTFDAVQSLIKSKSDNRHRSNKGDYLLTGILRHNNCNMKMYGKKNPNRKDYRYYQCSSCYFSISIRKIEKIVIDNFKEYSQNLKELKKNVRIKKVTPEKEVNSVKSKRKRIVQAYMDGNIEREYYLKEIESIDKIIKVLEKKIETPKKEKTLTNYDILIKLLKNFDEKDNVEKNSILKLLIDEIIIIDRENIEIIFKV
ncbi:recombinase family protein [uncultured Ilyobacter sp.]|uniref:recombinase family protein n=1 Tax=uncultured Ilyobacter sp. TaxID=544433 RepID=UPI0029C0A82E|nr:recombinase family protein [uncultured Ilyobacter sp.]